MSEITFSGPVTVSPELMLSLWKAMPPVAQSGVAQLFFSRFVTSPIAEAAVTAGAKIFFDKAKVPEAAASALREAVNAKCRALGEKTVNQDAVQTIVMDELRKAAAEFAKGKIETLLSAIPLEAMIAAATPAVVDVVKAVSHHYFGKTDRGQAFMLGLVEKACDGADGLIREVLVEQAARTAKNNGLDVAVGRQII